MLIKSQMNERYINSEYIISTYFDFDWSHAEGYADIEVFLHDLETRRIIHVSSAQVRAEISVKLTSGEDYCIYYETDYISSVEEYKEFVNKNREIYESLVAAIAYSGRERIYNLEESAYC